MSRILSKRVFPLYLKTISRNDSSPKCLSTIFKFNKLNDSLVKEISPAVSSSKWRTISTTNVSQSDAKSSNKPTPDIESDEEFRNILKDFAADFNLNVDSEGPILEEIKKSLNEPEIEVPTGSKKDASSSESSPKSSAVVEKYKKFSESDSVVIPNQEELETGTYTEEEITFHVDQNWKQNTSEIPYKRGISGVFEIEEIVSLLRKENLADIAVISIPKELHYADFLILVTALSPRHSEAVSEYIIKTYKKKKHSKDPFIIVEGGKTANWKCLDMGNIVIHILQEETRAFYDIESLWLFDKEFDSGGTLKSDPVYDTLEEQMAFFNSLQNSTTETVEKIP